VVLLSPIVGQLSLLFLPLEVIPLLLAPFIDIFFSLASGMRGRRGQSLIFFDLDLIVAVLLLLPVTT
jgi:hypothetical protein